MRRFTITLAIASATLMAISGCSGRSENASTERSFKEVLNERCTRCHSSSKWEGRDFTPEAWLEVLEQMKQKGVDIPDDDYQILKHWAK